MENRLLVAGTAAFDTIESPYGKRERVLGGSGVYTSLSAKFFVKPILLTTVGGDFNFEELLSNNGIDIKLISQLKEEKTFHWNGSYLKDLNNAETVNTELNVLLKFNTKIPTKVQNTEYLFLANIDPDFQIKILNQMKNLKFSGLDTMNFWINSKKDMIFSLLTEISVMFINENELKLLSEENNVFKGAKKILSRGLKNLVVKRGEYGSILFSEKNIFILPAFPLEEVVDPTGAGDTFAGAFMGYVAQRECFDFKTLKEALIWGTVAASFCVSDFSVSKMLSINFEDLAKRKDEFIAFLL